MRIPALAALVCVVLLGCSVAPVVSGGVSAGTPIQFDPDDAERRQVGALFFMGGVELDSPNPRFGGFSSMLLSEDGKGLVMLSDRGRHFRASLIHDDAGCLVGAKVEDGGVLLQAPEGRLSRQRDSEGLARLGRGVFVTFESRHAIWHFEDGLDGKPVEIRPPSDMLRLPRNSGIEAVAALPDGRLLMIAEDGEGQESPAWIGGKDGWQRLYYLRTGDFRPTDAAVLPSGDVLVLERAFSWVGGFAARIVRVPAAAIAPGARLIGQELATIAPPLAVDNFEAIAIRPESEGRATIYVLSDDNFNFAQRTLLMQFGVKDAP